MQKQYKEMNLMGITSILATTLKNLPWRTIAIAAMERAPELFQKARERVQKPGDQQISEAAVETELQERIIRLEALLLEQEDLTRKQAAHSTFLEGRCALLESRLHRFKIFSGVLFAAAMVLLFLLLK
jgi:hypothetical protein